MSLELSIKNKLLARCIEIKEESKAYTLAAMDESQHSANEYGPARDRYDSFRNQLMRKRDMLAQQLNVLQEDLRFLSQQKFESNSTEVEFGALVELNTQIVFILIGLGKIEIDNKPYYVISPVVPLVEAMKGLKAGDSFNFRGNAMKIKAVI